MPTKSKQPIPDILIAILAGGRSSRMGRDKADIQVSGGRSMLERACDAAAGTDCNFAVVGRHGEPLHLPDGGKVRMLPDITPGTGPAGGLITAMLSVKPSPDVLLCPCDTPGLQTGHLSWLIEKWRNVKLKEPKSRELGIVPIWDGRDQLLFAVYSGRCLPLLQQLLGQGRRALRDLLEAGDFYRVQLPSEYHGAVVDVDTPADLARYIDAQDFDAERG